MKLLLILVILSNIIFANNSIDFKLKTEKNRALILEQDRLNDFLPFIGNPWFEDEKFSKELLDKYIYAVRYIKNKKVLNDKSNFINMPASIYGSTGENIRSDKDILLAFSRKDFSDYQLFQYASQSLKKDKDFVNILLDRGENIYPYIDISLQEDESIIKKCMNLSVLNYKRLPKKYRKNKQLTIQAVKKYGYLLEYADDILKDDIEVINEGFDALGGYRIIKYASKRLRDNKQLMLKIIKKYPDTVEYASNRLKKDKEFITLAVSERFYNFKFADITLKKDETYIKMLIQKDGNVLKYADQSLQNNPELIKMALDTGLSSLAFALEKIQKNRDFALKLLSKRSSIRNIHSSLYADAIYMLEAIKKNPYNIKYVQNELKDNIDLALVAIKQDVQVYLYLSKNLQENTLIKAYLPKKKKVQKFNLLAPPLQQKKGAIRGVSISFLVVSEERSLKYKLIAPPKGMKITKKIVGESCLTPSLGKGESGVVVRWDIPIDIEEKTYHITMKGIDKEGNTEEITFPIKVPKTKPIQTKIENNELTVTDKSSNLYGMKMKGHSGEDISNLKLRSVAYSDVWKKRVKNKKPENIVEKIVFIMDNMPNSLDMKAPNLFDTDEKWIKTGAKIYKYYETIDNDSWKKSYMVYSGTMQYDGITGFVIPYKTSWDRSNGSKVYMFILSKAQNKSK